MAVRKKENVVVRSLVLTNLKPISSKTKPENQNSGRINVRYVLKTFSIRYNVHKLHVRLVLHKISHMQ